ncbi:TIGR03086 family protein [Rhodococcus sp. 06-470-2]|uniref:TIGR03086 family metal-binding protein n=1 Tax=unclassified Rhodococcus (in: high G+C Gram-positive bacteria) TaxID=192944 RepID=UPI000B9B299B|nr:MULTISPECIES: TIGR03086 family metal-binding protein [unclassified Rhodococcus (in: high G+C Gram-positive bacteria)]OZC70720.1 TIGR03086 family protein [Rhodococcus sp. 06-470-2]OZE72023.1 TIGR03086 family protein [Rhodococcus sp. 05-2221-1B]
MTAHETEIVADEKVPTIEIIREFDAAPERVFRAHIDPELYRQWVGPRSLTTRILKWQGHTGGAWAFANDRDGEEIASFFGSFHEVRPNERIVWTFTYEGQPDSVALETLTFENREGGGTLLRVLSVMSDFASRDGMLSSGMDVGVKEGYDKLDELLAQRTGPAEQHLQDAAAFTALVLFASPEDWSRPSPVSGWAAIDVVKHLIVWSRGFLAGGAGIELQTLDVEADPAAAWTQHVADIQAILDDPAGRILSNPHTGDMPVDKAIEMFYTADVWMHSWDLAKALGREPDLGQERCAVALEAMRPMEQMLRDSGQYGPAVPVADDASPQDKLMAFIGRDPAWSPRS